MTPKEKAKELYDRFRTHSAGDVSDLIVKEYNKEVGGGENIKKTLTQLMKFSKVYNAKQCALIAVDEILDGDNLFVTSFKDDHKKYWEQVKEEINNL